jgi:hypothetical protein
MNIHSYGFNEFLKGSIYLLRLPQTLCGLSSVASSAIRTLRRDKVLNKDMLLLSPPTHVIQPSCQQLPRWCRRERPFRAGSCLFRKTEILNCT